jgi:hypothetical protein
MKNLISLVILLGADVRGFSPIPWGGRRQPIRLADSGESNHESINQLVSSFSLGQPSDDVQQVRQILANMNLQKMERRLVDELELFVQETRKNIKKMEETMLSRKRLQAAWGDNRQTTETSLELTQQLNQTLASIDNLKMSELVREIMEKIVQHRNQCLGQLDADVVVEERVAVSVSQAQSYLESLSGGNRPLQPANSFSQPSRSPHEVVQDMDSFIQSTIMEAVTPEISRLKNQLRESTQLVQRSLQEVSQSLKSGTTEKSASEARRDDASTYTSHESIRTYTLDSTPEVIDPAGISEQQDRGTRDESNQMERQSLSENSQTMESVVPDNNGAMFTSDGARWYSSEPIPAAVNPASVSEQQEQDTTREMRQTDQYFPQEGLQSMETDVADETVLQWWQEDPLRTSNGSKAPTMEPKSNAAHPTDFSQHQEQDNQPQLQSSQATGWDASDVTISQSWENDALYASNGATAYVSESASGMTDSTYQEQKQDVTSQSMYVDKQSSQDSPNVGLGNSDNANSESWNMDSSSPFQTEPGFSQRQEQREVQEDLHNWDISESSGENVASFPSAGKSEYTPTPIPNMSSPIPQQREQYKDDDDSSNPQNSPVEDAKGAPTYKRQSIAMDSSPPADIVEQQGQPQQVQEERINDENFVEHDNSEAISLEALKASNSQSSSHDDSQDPVVIAPPLESEDEETVARGSIPEVDNAEPGRSFSPLSWKSLLSNWQADTSSINAPPVNSQSVSNPKLKVQGGSLRTLAIAKHSIKRVQVNLETEGRPLNAQVELWQGPGHIPQTMRIYSEDGKKRPFRAMIETPAAYGSVAIRNTSPLEFPFSADLEADDIDAGDASADQTTRPSLVPLRQQMSESCNPTTIQGDGATETYPFSNAVGSVMILLWTDGRPLKAKIELMQGPNTNRQVVEVYSEDGGKRPFFAVIETPGFMGSTVRIENTGPMEYPIRACVEPYRIEELGDDESDGIFVID